MLSFSDHIYYILILICIILSFTISGRELPGLKYLRLLLIVAFTGEFVNEFIDEYTEYVNVFYHFYIPFEFTMFTLFFSANINLRVPKRIRLGIILLYILFCFVYSSFFGKLTNYPSIQYNLDCLLVAIFIIITLLSVPPHGSLSITRLPIFWFCTGLLIFYVGIVLYNGTKNGLEKSDSELARVIRLNINMNLNYLLYLSWIYGFICAIRIKNSSLL